MKESLQNKLANIRKHGYQLDFGQVIEQTFANYKKLALIQGLILLVILIIFTVVIGSVAGLAFGVGNLTQYFTDYNVNDITSVVLLINYAVTVAAAALAAPFTAGLIKMAHNVEEKIDLEFSTVFEYYKSGYFKELFTVGLLVSLFAAGIDTAIGLLVQGYVDGFAAIGLRILSGIINITVSLLTLFALPLVIFENASATDAIKGSIEIIKQKFWTILALELIVIVCAILGFFGCCVGLFFTIPLIYSAIYIMYRTAVGMNEEHEIDEIGIEYL